MEKNFWQQLTKPIIGLAPMDGVTDEPMRQIQCQIAKPDVIYTEFINVEGYCRNPEAFEKKLTFEENERPIIAQVFGYTPNCFKQTIAGICKRGFDGIDINMGCPAKKVLQKGGGGDLIDNYSSAEKIILESLKGIKKSGREIPLSVKTRIGKEKPNVGEWFNFLSGFPLAEVSVHGRLLSQGLSGLVNWEEIWEAAKILHRKNIICLGNGGIESVSEGKMFSLKYNLDGVLVGQAVLGNPWFFKNGYIPNKDEILHTIISHGEKAYAFYGQRGYLSVLKHYGWYPKGFPGSKNLRVSLQKTKTFAEVKEIITKFKASNNR